jgi:inhibitor of cysteine peptidase
MKFFSKPSASTVKIVSPIIAFLVFLSGLIIFLNVRSSDDDFQTFSSCRQMENYISSNSLRGGYDTFPIAEPFAISEDTTVGTDSFMERGSTAENMLQDSISETNIQVEGVDESDLLKTDGEFAFYLNNYELYMYSIQDEASPMLVHTKYLEDGGDGLYLSGDTLIVSSSRYSPSFDNYYSSDSVNYFQIYEIDRAEQDLNFVRGLAIQGDLLDSRVIGSNLHIVSSNYFYFEDSLFSSIEEYIPRYAFDNGENSFSESNQFASCGDTSYFGSNVNNFISIMSINFEEEELVYDSSLILGDSTQMYMSNQNLYLTSRLFPEPREGFDFDDVINEEYESEISTEIFKLKIDGTSIEFANKGNVPGILLDQFAMDEYYGNLRVATTTQNWFRWNDRSRNNLYILNEDMTTRSSIEGLAQGEEIKSARFIGDKGYIVTFREVDPLFAIDLSDLDNPKVLGELKITGFSEYLHPLGENHLLGVGYEADTNGFREGVKISIFDVSDPTNPVEVSKKVYGEGGFTPVAFNHRAFTINEEEGYIIIPVDIYDSRHPLEAMSLDYLRTQGIDFDGSIVVRDPSDRSLGSISSDKPELGPALWPFLQDKVDTNIGNIGFGGEITGSLILFKDYLIDIPEDASLRGFIVVDINENRLSDIVRVPMESFDTEEFRSMYKNSNILMFGGEELRNFSTETRTFIE